MAQFNKSRAKADAAAQRQVAAWSRWQETDSAEDQAAWMRACDAQRVAEDAADEASDRWESWEYERESRQADWWVAAKANACAGVAA